MLLIYEIRLQADREVLAGLLACLKQTLGWEPEHDEREIVVPSEREDEFVRALDKCNKDRGMDWGAVLMPPKRH